MLDIKKGAMSRYGVLTQDPRRPRPNNPWVDVDPAQAMRDLFLYLRCAVSKVDCNDSRLMQGLVQMNRFRQVPSVMSLSDSVLFQKVFDAYRFPNRTLTDEELNTFYEKALPNGILHLPYILTYQNQACSWFLRKDNGIGYWISCLAVSEPSRVTNVLSAGPGSSGGRSSWNTLGSFSSLASKTIRFNFIAPEELVNKRLLDIRSVLLDTYAEARTSQTRKEIVEAIRKAIWETFHLWFEKKKDKRLLLP